jgi:hypothetical protein
MKTTFASNTFAAGSFRCETLAGRMATTAKRFVVVEAQTALAGTSAGQAVHAGAVLGQEYHTGAITGQCNG